jgi:hypothetical protein
MRVRARRVRVRVSRIRMRRIRVRRIRVIIRAARMSVKIAASVRINIKRAPMIQMIQMMICHH